MSQKQTRSEEGRLLAILSYILPVIGGIIGLATNRDNTLTRVHAQQSIGAVLTLLASFVIWGISAYIVAIVPAIREIIVALTFALILVGFLAFLYYLLQLPADHKRRSSGIRKLIWTAVIYSVGSIIVVLSQTSPDLVAFAVPVIELLQPVSELFMPVLLLATVLVLGGGILPGTVMTILGVSVALNMLTWMPLAGPVIAVALYGIVIALVIFLIVNWGIGLLRALQGREHKIPIANQITARLFSDAEKLKAAPVRA